MLALHMVYMVLKPCARPPKQPMVLKPCTRPPKPCIIKPWVACARILNNSWFYYILYMVFKLWDYENII